MPIAFGLTATPGVALRGALIPEIAPAEQQRAPRITVSLEKE
jgi:hypothetical protein